MCGILIIGVTALLGKINASKAKINTICSILLTTLVFITGFSPSVIRATIMASMAIFASICHKKSDVLNNLAIALLITLIMNPYNINSMSVLLSYGGVLRNCMVLRNHR